MQASPLLKFRQFTQSLRQLTHLDELQNHFLFNLPFWIAAGITGIISVLYARLFVFCEDWALAHSSGYLILVLAPVTITVSFLLAHFFSREASGSGIPQIMASVATPENQTGLHGRLFGFRMLIVKILGACVCVLGGGSTGREGPTLQISAAIFYQVSRLWPKSLPRPQQTLMVLAGGAGGLAAAFNTPLGGVVFAIEELSKTHISHIRTSIFQAVIICGVVAQMFMGNYLYLGQHELSQDMSGVLTQTLILAFLIGLVGAGFAQLLYFAGRWRSRQKFGGKLAITLACGLCFSLVFWICGPTTLGGGKRFMLEALQHADSGANVFFPVARVLGNFFTYVAGAIGGIFAPALASGAAIAQYLTSEFHLQAPRVMMLVGMAAFLTGVTRTPFTSFVLVLEMSDSHEVILYLMLSAFVASLAGYLISPRSFYEQAAHDILQENTNQTPAGHPAPTGG